MGIREIQIVQVSLQDLKKLQEFSTRTFYQTFAEVNSQENMQSYRDEHFSDEMMKSELLNTDSRFYFAKTGDEIFGYIKINQGPAQSVLPNDQGLEIERIYIDREFKGNGIGKLFIDKAIEIAMALNANYIWLGVWEHNLPAIRFYEKNGFRQYSQHIFKLGDDEQTDLLMKRMLNQ